MQLVYYLLIRAGGILTVLVSTDLGAHQRDNNKCEKEKDLILIPTHQTYVQYYASAVGVLEYQH